MLLIARFAKNRHAAVIAVEGHYHSFQSLDRLPKIGFFSMKTDVCQDKDCVVWKRFNDARQILIFHCRSNNQTTIRRIGNQLRTAIASYQKCKIFFRETRRYESPFCLLIIGQAKQQSTEFQPSSPKFGKSFGKIIVGVIRQSLAKHIGHELISRGRLNAKTATMAASPQPRHTPPCKLQYCHENPTKKSVCKLTKNK